MKHLYLYLRNQQQTPSLLGVALAFLGGYLFSTALFIFFGSAVRIYLFSLFH